MIDTEKAKKEFLEYTNNFDTTNPHIKGKIYHSIRVSEISLKIAKKLKLDEEEIKLAELIGILHDIGRFEQYTKYKTFKDLKSIDHGMLGVKILKENNYIRKYIKEHKYDQIIEKAINNHNKFQVEKGLSEKEELFTKIIRDADKLDIFYEAEEIFWKNEKEEIESSKISEKVYNEFMSKRIIENSLKQNNLDKFIGIISFIYDINFKESLEIIKEQNYIKKIIERFDFKNQQTKEQIKEIEKISEEYLKNIIKG